MTNKTQIAELQRPERDRYDWNKSVYRECAYCGKNHTQTVLEEDNTPICAKCVDQNYWAKWESLAEQALAKLESAEAEISALRGASVPVDSESFCLTEAACEQWKEASIQANKKVASLGDENRKLRAELAKSKASNAPAGIVDGWVKEIGSAFQYKLTSMQNLEDGTQLFAHPAPPVLVLPEAFSMLHRTEFSDPYHCERVFKAQNVVDMLTKAGITVKSADGEGA